jgi:hypothetical protein
MPTSIHLVFYFFFPSFFYSSLIFFLLFDFLLLVLTQRSTLTVQHSIVNPSNEFNTKMLAQGLFIAVRFFAVHVEVYHGSTER